MDLTFWVSATLAAIFVGLGKGGLPVMATLAVPSLSLVMSPIAAAGLLLPVYIVSDVFALFAYRRDYNSKVLKIAFVGMTLGVIVGAFTAHMIIEWVITFLIGSMGAIFALRMLLQKQSIPSDERVAIKVSQGVFWTTIAGFTSFISHNGGPPWQIFTLRLNLPKSVFVGTSVIAFSYVNFIKLFPYVWLGQIDYESTYVSLYLMLPASLAVFIGVKAVKVIPDPVFYNFVTWALLLISIKLMFDGIYIGLLVD